MRARAICLFVSFALLTKPAFGHEGEAFSGGFVSGMAHPVFGWDHIAAMVAVGLWGAILEKPAIWLLPIVFPLVMAIGAALGIVDAPIPFVEAGIALSGLVFGVLIVFFVKVPLALAAVLVGFFAVFHGYAHGSELPSAVNPVAYGVGFVVSTGLLHAIGILFGTVISFEAGRYFVRVTGALIAAIGTAFLVGFV